MAEWTAAYINDLPDSSFAVIEAGGEKDADGKTTPRSLRHLPYKDANGKVDLAHLRNALARLPQTDLSGADRAKAERVLNAAAKEAGIGAQKAWAEVKAEPMSSGDLDRWLAGRRPRRILVLPHGGPIPKADAPLGVDIDGEWFSERTDIFDGHKALLETRQRVVDWHHDQDPTGTMKGAILGSVILDDHDESVSVDEELRTGRWGDLWANAGEKRLALVAQLEARGARIFGSSEAAYKKASPTGEILTWPIIREAMSTSPQNTYAVMPPLKAVLTHPLISEVPAGALKALLFGLDNLASDLRATSLGGEPAAKAGRVLSAANEAALSHALSDLSGVLDQLQRYAAAERDEGEP